MPLAFLYLRSGGGSGIFNADASAKTPLEESENKIHFATTIQKAAQGESRHALEEMQRESNVNGGGTHAHTERERDT